MLRWLGVRSETLVATVVAVEVGAAAVGTATAAAVACWGRLAIRKRSPKEVRVFLLPPLLGQARPGSTSCHCCQRVHQRPSAAVGCGTAAAARGTGTPAGLRGTYRGVVVVVVVRDGVRDGVRGGVGRCVGGIRHVTDSGGDEGYVDIYAEVAGAAGGGDAAAHRPHRESHEGTRCMYRMGSAGSALCMYGLLD